ncbi:kinase-like domain-containing protein [Protomyces lactucae-debilis]|uniref:non-specific serine/threonine protein kinase n=1 Tax=Protomyces lactucae-debilis TaxID=2754530 RepID=A0A1Y2F679_PROLT|nr:kinase-like domain-containing protein [Protomyces lactucae-debilis]ORY79392.1 kinase-like domain-containing protein [Protomyces lactucae-debilis]
MNPQSDYEQEVPQSDLQDLTHLSDRYNLISKIGEGTFSTVYKAEDLQQDSYCNDWLTHLGGDPCWNYFVAIKRLYVTASPARIYNELDILQKVRRSKHILPVITSFRHEDQVFIVLPYYKHADFRAYFRDLSILDIRFYMRSLMRGLKDLSDHGIMHRDIKPCNFLYDVHRREGQLVDFGLAEYAPPLGEGGCPCRARSEMDDDEMRKIDMISPTHAKLSRSYLKEDHRPGKRANRSGTRGFRAPEVLLKCDRQNQALDMWSAGVILLTFLSGRFPFFNSADDIDALIELTAIFGKGCMRRIARIHNQTLEIDLPTVHERSISWPRLITWCQTGTRDADLNVSLDMQEAATFLDGLLDLDPWHRTTAVQALQDPFLALVDEDRESLEQQIAAQKIESDATHLDSESKSDPGVLARDGSLASLRQLRSPAKLDEFRQGIQQLAPSTDHATLSVDQVGQPREYAETDQAVLQARLHCVDKIVANTQKRIVAMTAEITEKQHNRPALSDLEHIHNFNVAPADVASHGHKHARGHTSPVKPAARPTKRARKVSSPEDPFKSKVEVKPFGLFGSFMQDKADRERPSQQDEQSVSRQHF